MNNNVSAAKLAIALVLLAAAIYFLAQPLINNINLGLDLQGGAQVVLQAIPDPGKTVTPDDMTRMTSVMRKRVDEFGISEPVIQREGSDRLIVELAGIEDPEAAINLLGQTAKLEFRDPDGNVVLSGEELADAKANTNPKSDGSGFAISLTFNDEGARKFGEATARLVGQTISIYLDDKELTSPRVNEPIMSGGAEMSGGYKEYKDASNMAAILRGGALPVKIEIMSKQTVGPSLGQDSLQKSIMASIIGLIIMALFMLLYYRVPGFLACVSLVLYVFIVFGIMALFRFTLTLPGIAGFVLSIGMAVDANIIIYERLKEELRGGKSLPAAIESGFKRALATILDSNITTLIASLVLIYFGTGSIKGFGITLTIGLITNLLTAITFSRYLLRWTSEIGPLGSKKLFGL